ncbi:MAG: iron-sulfur cluster assembly accessory protein [Bryobacteraceae bacterium]|jgi:iron-sulfur cluster assembly protein
MVNLTERAVGKVKEILSAQEPQPAGLRIAVVGGGCSGFSYSMAFENAPNMLDKTYTYEGLKIFVDQASMLYLEGAEVDYVETLEGAGFKFNNPNVKSTCGCGSSFSA